MTNQNMPDFYQQTREMREVRRQREENLKARAIRAYQTAHPGAAIPDKVDLSWLEGGEFTWLTHSGGVVAAYRIEPRGKLQRLKNPLKITEKLEDLRRINESYEEMEEEAFLDGWNSFEAFLQDWAQARGVPTPTRHDAISYYERLTRLETNVRWKSEIQETVDRLKRLNARKTLPEGTTFSEVDGITVAHLPASAC